MRGDVRTSTNQEVSEILRHVPIAKMAEQTGLTAGTICSALDGYFYDGVVAKVAKAYGFDEDSVRAFFYEMAR